MQVRRHKRNIYGRMFKDVVLHSMVARHNERQAERQAERAPLDLYAKLYPDGHLPVAGAEPTVAALDALRAERSTPDELPTPSATEFSVKRAKDNELVGTYATAEEAQAVIDKAVKQRKAKLVLA